MSGYRQLHTRMWADGWFIELSPEQKLLFIYLFSNQRASVCGLYELPLRVMVFETGLEIEVIRKCFTVFSRSGKAFYDHAASVVWVVNMLKYQGSSSPKLLARIDADIKAVPECDLKKKFLEAYPNNTVLIPYGDGIDTAISISGSILSSGSISVDEGGTGGETKNRAVEIFLAHFGSFNGNGKRETKRWEDLVESIGLERAEEIASWAEHKEIHMDNRGGLLDSLETAAKNWQVKTVGKLSKSPGVKPPLSGLEVSKKVNQFFGEEIA